MDRDETVGRQMDKISMNTSWPELLKIGKNLMLVYGIVAIFACLYFGLMIYLLFFRQQAG